MFKFEKPKKPYIWANGEQQTVKYLRIKKDIDNITEFLTVEHIITTGETKTFMNRKYGPETIDINFSRLGLFPTFKEYWEIRQSYKMNDKSDSLGGFNSGQVFEITNKDRLENLLEKLEREGWIQIPYLTL